MPLEIVFDFSAHHKPASALVYFGGSTFAQPFLPKYFACLALTSSPP